MRRSSAQGDESSESTSGSDESTGPLIRSIREHLGIATPHEGFNTHGEHQVNMALVEDAPGDATLGHKVQRWFDSDDSKFQGRSLSPFTGRGENGSWIWNFVKVLDHHALIGIQFQVATAIVPIVLGIQADIELAFQLKSLGRVQQEAFIALCVSGHIAWVLTGVWQTQCDALMKDKYIHDEGLTWHAKLWLQMRLLCLYIIGAPLIMLDVGFKTVWQRRIMPPQDYLKQHPNFVIGLGYKNAAGAMADNMRGTRSLIAKLVFGDLWMIIISVQFQLAQGLNTIAVLSCVWKLANLALVILKTGTWLSYDLEARRAVGAALPL